MESDDVCDDLRVRIYPGADRILAMSSVPASSVYGGGDWTEKTTFKVGLNFGIVLN
jgi:hypothetical protein